MELVLVYSGNTWPTYLEANLRYLRNKFFDKEITLLVDNPNFPRSYEKFCKCVVIDYKSELMQSLFNNLTHDKTFWDGFWFKTIERFFLLENYMGRNPSESILHIEADVLLLPNFPFEKIEKIPNGLAFPIISESQAVASVFFVRDLHSLRTFLNFAFEYSLHDPTATDMSILANYALNSGDVFILPTIPKYYAPNYDNSELFRRSQMKENSELDSLFDGATYGQYLFGIDPRNNLGNRKIFKVFPNHFVNPSKFEFFLGNLDSSVRLCFQDESGAVNALCCLHVHSKDLRAFALSEDCSIDLLGLRVRQTSSKKELSEFVPSLLITEFSAFSRAIFHKLIILLKRVLT